MPAPVPNTPAFRPFDRLIIAAERATGLLARCQPVNAHQERARLAECFAQNKALKPALAYAAPPDLRGVRQDLEQAHRRLGEDTVSGLYAARLEELLLELDIVALVGSRRLRGRAQRRFCGPEATAGDCVELAERWAKAGEPEERHAPVMSDDAGDPSSLLSLLRGAIGVRRLPFRVAVSSSLSAVAATGDGIVYVAAGRPLSPSAAQRIAVHELHGHVLPRERARHQALGLFQAGSAGGNDEQEGLALYYEAHNRLLGPARQAELAQRHLAALALFDGASFHDVVTRLVRTYGAEPEAAVALGLRVFRGGGLGREAAYLPAFLRVAARIASDSSVLRWLDCGRLSLKAIGVLRVVAGDPYLLAERPGGDEPGFRCPLSATGGRISETIGR